MAIGMRARFAGGIITNHEGGAYILLATPS
jgi:hypothetical protein